MTLLLYAVAEDDACGDLPDAGIGGRPLRKLSHEGLAAFVSEKPEALGATEQALLDYEQAVERLMAVTPLLPARFGTVIDSDAVVTQLLGERQREFTTALERVRGAVELGLRAEWLPAPHGPAPTDVGAGTAYMRGRLAERRRSHELAREIECKLADVVRASTPGTLTDSRTAFSASFLVAVGDVDEFLRRLEGLENSSEGVTFVCTGPWPPYSFADAEAQ